MWSARKFNSVFQSLIAMLMLASCTLYPLSNIDRATYSHFRQIDLPAIDSRESQLLNQTLKSYIGNFNPDRKYQLVYKLTEATKTTLSSAGSNSELNNTTMSINYRLTDISTGAQLTAGTIRATATSGAISSYYGQDVSQNFSSERLVKLLGERLYQKLQLYFISLEV